MKITILLIFKPCMTANLKKVISALLALLALAMALFTPTVIAANKKPRGFFPNAARCIGRVCRFVVSVPDRATHFLGPVIGPLASEFITAGIAPGSNLSRLLTNARRTENFIKNVEAQREIVSQVRQAYRDQAVRIKSEGEKIRALRRNLGEKLISGQMSLSDYQSQIVSLDRVADIYDLTAVKLNTAADKFNDKNVINLVGQGLLDQFIVKVRGAVVFSAVNELNRVIDPAIINTLVATQNRDFNSLLDMIFAGDISRIVSDPANKDIDFNILKDNIRADIRQLLKENKNNFGNNFKNKLTEIINRRLQELRQTVAALPTIPIVPTSAPPASADSRCPAGYRWDRMSGVGCVQINCATSIVPFAHWSYTGDCVCGSAGSINENKDDPNKRCTRPHEFTACPDCVYACVHNSEPCPPQP